MNIISLIYLISLSAIWGFSFLFMRLAVPYLGPVWLVEARVGIGAVFLLILAILIGNRLHIKQYWRQFAILGFFNMAFPFVLFAYAAQTLTASMLAVLNSTAPIWGVLIALLLRGGKLSVRTVIGLILGVLGVYLLVSLDPVILHPNAVLAIIATIIASGSYGIASNYAAASDKIEPIRGSHGTMWAATLMLLPFLAFSPVVATPSSEAVLAVVLLGVLCSGFAYILYYSLINRIGAASALTVTYLVPMFGILWGHIFLDEVVGLHTLYGACLVLLGTALVTGFSFKIVFSGTPSKNER